MLEGFKFHHIGYAVKDILISSELYVKNGWKLSDTVIDDIQNAKIAFLTKDNFPLIELVAPIDDNSPVVNTLSKNGVCPYHICYEVIDINNSIELMKKERFVLLFKPVPAAALQNRKICYLYNNNVGLIEILEA